MFDSIIKLITDVLNYVDVELIAINTSYLPEWTGEVLAKSVRFLVDEVAPLINGYINILM